MAGNKLTDREIESAKPRTSDYYLTDGAGVRGDGQLVLRVSANGAKRFYYRYTAGSGKRVRLPIGTYGRAGLTLKDARLKVAELRGLHRNEESRDVRAYYIDQAEARRRAAEEEKRIREEAEAQARRGREALERYTLRRLLEIYASRLADARKQSAADVRGVFERHVFRPNPDLASRPAAEVTARDVVALLRALTENGKGRTAAKLRSYLHAAFALAVRAEFDPGAPAELVRFGLTANPVAPVGALSQFNQARDRILTESELTGYWKALDHLSPMTRDVLRLALLLGGQRLSQLLRVSLTDVDVDARTITLRDGKGARKQPRLHVLPLCADALTIAKYLVERARGSSTLMLFTNDGYRPLGLETLSSAVREVSAGLVRGGVAATPFQLRDVRRTCETMLAALRVPSDVRAQIQSHGLGGIQTRHYDRHDYRQEKLEALQSWERKLRWLMRGESPALEGDIVFLQSTSAAG
mgnify:CR=1 FL=1